MLGIYVKRAIASFSRKKHNKAKKIGQKVNINKPTLESAVRARQREAKQRKQILLCLTMPIKLILYIYIGKDILMFT